jgi:hypothetical protein
VVGNGGDGRTPANWGSLEEFLRDREVERWRRYLTSWNDGDLLVSFRHDDWHAAAPVAFTRNAELHLGCPGGLVRSGRYAVYSYQSQSREPEYCGVFRVVDGVITFDSLLDQLNCDFYPPGPMTPFFEGRFLNRLANHGKNPFAVQVADDFVPPE